MRNDALFGRRSSGIKVLDAKTKRPAEGRKQEGGARPPERRGGMRFAAMPEVKQPTTTTKGTAEKAQKPILKLPTDVLKGKSATGRAAPLQALAEKVDRENLYSPLQAAKLAKETSTTSYDATVEVAMRLGVDPRKADQMVRGTVNLPHGTGKTARVLVFATGERAAQAEAAGAEFVGSDDLITRIQGGWTDFDAVVATPDLMGKVGRLGKVLGPRGLMPNPKTGTVTMDVAKAVEEIKGGKIEFRTDKHANLHFIIGKVSFTDLQLVENYGAALEEVLRLKPSASKGRYITKATISTTNGPGILVDQNKTRRLTEEEDEVA